MENKPASLLVPLGKAINGIPPYWCGKTDGWQLLSKLVYSIDRFLVIEEPICNEIQKKNAKLFLSLLRFI